MDVVVVGGGVSGLSSALKLSRAGHQVTVIERDDTPMPDSPDQAFFWDRRGAPQVRHSHAFLARLVTLLKANEPDVVARLYEAGATELRFGEDLPPTMTNYSPEAGDDELTMLTCRRTTFEWVLRRVVLDEGRVRFQVGVGVNGLVHRSDPETGLPHVLGVRLEDGSERHADLVVVAGGRRSVLPEWLDDIGAGPVPEFVEDTGIVYTSRFYRLKPDATYPPRSGPIGGDLGYIKYGVFVGDNRTFSITLAAPTDDSDLRTRLADPVVFDEAARQLVTTAPYLDGRAEPIVDDVYVMAGLLNRHREYVVDGRPLVLGLLPVGDAVICTNPLYGRGCSIGYWGAHLMCESLEKFPGGTTKELFDLAVDYDAAIGREIVPWYRSGVEQDAEARRVAAALLRGDDPDGDTSDPKTMMRSVMREGLLPALRSDAVVLRAFMRTLNLMSAPDALMKDADVMNRVFAVWQDRENRPAEVPMGPKKRSDFLALLPA
ncbi:MAG: FAD-dependent oxidoreductase [Actinomycetota bacterium]|nr:FAD-dependent oxidoreductase [Actinomycetota bacterium]MDA2972352.1 FAD-dependent oxidoreductase [Actinomycetota bacterium]MDA3000636.1 FAD-dependent oxidoreductase [Actinomycetota bacterium]